MARGRAVAGERLHAAHGQPEARRDLGRLPGRRLVVRLRRLSHPAQLAAIERRLEGRVRDVVVEAQPGEAQPLDDAAGSVR